MQLREEIRENRKNDIHNINNSRKKIKNRKETNNIRIFRETERI